MLACESAEPTPIVLDALIVLDQRFLTRCPRAKIGPPRVSIWPAGACVDNVEMARGGGKWPAEAAKFRGDQMTKKKKGR